MGSNLELETKDFGPPEKLTFSALICPEENGRVTLRLIRLPQQTADDRRGPRLTPGRQAIMLEPTTGKLWQETGSKPRESRWFGGSGKAESGDRRIDTKHFVEMT